MKKKFTILIAAIAAIILITQPLKSLGQTKDDYTIEFKDTGTSSDGTSARTAISDIISSGADYVSTLSNCSRVYNAKSGQGVKLGANGGTGSFTMNLATAGQKKATKITIKAMQYSSTENDVKITINGSTNTTITCGSSMKEYEWTLNTATDLTSITIESNTKRIYVHSIKVTYGSTTTYNVNISTTISNGSLLADQDKAASGATVTLTADPDDGYMTNQFTVSKSEGTVTVTKTGLNTGTFTMPAEDVTANVTFVPTHTLSYSATNGTIKFDEGDPTASGSFAFGETLTTSVTATPALGYQFTGWTVTGEGASVENASVNPTTFTMGTENSTLTANFIQVITGTINFGSASGSTKIEGSSSSGSGTVTYTDTGNDSMGNTWTITTVTSNAKSFTQQESYSQVGASSKPVTSITFTTTLAESTTIADFQAKFGGFSNTAGTITLKVGSTTVGEGSLSGTSDVVVNNTSTASGTELKVTVTDIARGVKCYYISFTILTYDYYGTTTIKNFTIPVGEILTVHNGAVLEITGTLTNNGTAANLIIEDGGQLIASSSVAATFKKTMSAPSKVYGWELISSPVHDASSSTLATGNVTNLTTDSYDMFAYDEASHYWFNQKPGNEHSFSTLNNGQGYMYRNAGNELSFVGNTNSGAFTRELSCTSGAGDLAGFHLVGNPYTHDITLEDNVVLQDGDGDLAAEKQLAGYYLLKNGGSEWTSALATDAAISNKQGFLIQIPAEATKIKFTEGDEAKRGSRSNGDNIKFMVSNSQYEDVAYALFDEAYGLTKIDHRNADVPMLYINQNGKDYAIATMSDDTKAFNLNFKAATMGQYTLSYKADGKFEYLHVIDLLAGEDVDMLLEGEYSFMGSPRDNENRFLVKLSYKAGDNEPNDDIFAYQIGNEVLVSGTGELQIFDVTGRKVMTTTINGAESISVPAQGVYIFRLVGNEIKTQKIVVR